MTETVVLRSYHPLRAENGERIDTGSLGEKRGT